VRQARQLGVPNAQGEVDFAVVMRRVHEVIQTIAPHDSIERYNSLGVEVLQGHARITSPWTVMVRLPDGSEQTLSTRNIVIAAGASPLIPEIAGLKEAGFLTSDTLWGLKQLPRRLLVLGGGPIGCELAQSFARLGSAVTQVEMAPRLMVREDPEASELVAASLRADGVSILTGHQAVRVEVSDGEKRLIVRCGGQEQAIAFDELLCAVGRSPRVTGYGLEELGIALTPRNTIQTNAFLQTQYPNIYAVGDVAGPFQFTHTAAHQAWYAVVNALFGRIKRFKADYSVIPRATFTDPEVARVGLSEAEAREQGVAYELTR
jgi:pyruvate/2-oxoglutarate dehydrogenase complex dihydrolipoamide dehydrogenase (E3) component